MFRKNLASEIWAEIFSANQIAVFLQKRNLQNKSIKYPDFFHVDTNSKKLNFDLQFFGWEWPKMGVVYLVTRLYD